MRLRLISDHGFSLVEILIALMILTLAIIPIINAVGPAVKTTAAEAQISVFTNQARATLNRLLSVDYATLNAHQGDAVDLTNLFGSAAEADLESFLLNGKRYTPAVAITDASGGAGGLLRLAVTINQVQLTTLKADY
ncbi:MAG: prepilin-type N-terminal cleavage/methylation domain-containing protein [Desulfobacterales bacterium]|jgi:prepilin-type N-terminal cleavage/methylation domain-containing protein